MPNLRSFLLLLCRRRRAFLIRFLILAADVISLAATFRLNGVALMRSFVVTGVAVDDDVGFGRFEQISMAPWIVVVHVMMERRDHVTIVVRVVETVAVSMVIVVVIIVWIEDWKTIAISVVDARRRHQG